MPDLLVKPRPGEDVVVVAPSGTKLGSRVTYNADRTRVRVKNTGTWVEPTPVFTADFWVTGTGNDLADGLTPGTAWASLAKAFGSAPPGSRIALSGAVIGGALYDKALHLTTPPGVSATVTGPGAYSLRLQRASGSTITGAITILPPFIVAEPQTSGEKPGTNLGRCVELTDCSGLDLRLTVKAGTDFGIYGKDVRASKVWADVSDAGEGFRFGGDCTGTVISGIAHDCNRMVRNTAGTRSDDYGAVGFSLVNVKGITVRDARAERCFAPSFDYVADGGALEFYNATDCVVDGLVGIDCEGGFETGGSSGLGNHRNRVTGLRLLGDMGAGTKALGQPARSPVVLIRNFADSTLDCDIDATRARVGVEMYADTGQFGGSLENAVVTARVVPRGFPISSIRDIPASARVSVTEAA